MDGTANAFTAETVTGKYGYLVMGANGAWTYTTSSALNQLSAGEVVKDTITVHAADGTESLITVNITGTNDAAIIGSPTLVDVTEDTNVISGNLTATGTISISDEDTGQATISAEAVPGNLGTLYLAANGSYTYTVPNKATQYLGASDTKFDTFAITSADGTSKTVSFNVHGVNDAANIGAPTVADVTEDRSVTSGNLTATGMISISDVDSGQATISANASNGNWGILSLESDGSYSYTVSNAATQSLGANGTKVDTFTITSADGTAKEVTFNVHGTNDSAVIQTPTIVDVTEDIGVNDLGYLEAKGSISITDPDTAGSGQASFNTLVTSGSNNLGNLALNSDGSYTYTVLNAATQSLGSNDTKVDKFTISSVDGTTKAVSFNVHGANDAALITRDTTLSLTDSPQATIKGKLVVADVDSLESFVPMENVLGVNKYGYFSMGTDGNWSYTMNAHSFKAGSSHLDNFTAVTYDGTEQLVSVIINTPGENEASIIETDAAQAVSGNLPTSINNEVVTYSAVTKAGDYGTLKLESSGSWKYTMDSAHDELSYGVTVTDNFYVSTTYGSYYKTENGNYVKLDHGVGAYEKITVSLLGTNDAAVISGKKTFSLTETNDALTASGTLTSTDVDGARNAFTAETVTGTYGNLNMGAGGAWTYTAKNAQDQLGAGARATDNFVVHAADGTAATVQVNITGTNDNATISGTAAGTVTEDSLVKASGTLTVS
ncbi:MAG: hypothetical protein EBU92_11585, partial [Betaproteobacteria bacterium]|nr:hypothetical protein [Betaproteobacteria bacterium]